MFKRIRKSLNEKRNVENLEFREKIELLKKYKQLKIDHKRNYNLYKELEKEIKNNLEKNHNIYVSVEESTKNRKNIKEKSKVEKPKTPVEKVRQDMLKAKNNGNKKRKTRLFGSIEKQQKIILRIIENNKGKIKYLERKENKRKQRSNKTNTKTNKTNTKTNKKVSK